LIAVRAVVEKAIGLQALIPPGIHESAVVDVYEFLRSG